MLTASYDNEGVQVSKSVEVGPCLDKSNDCMGRCGAGCKGTLRNTPQNSTLVQRFTQQCLDHDLCTRETGEILGPCANEFSAAIDSFLFAPDCNAARLSGPWGGFNSSTCENLGRKYFTFTGKIRVVQKN